GRGSGRGGKSLSHRLHFFRHDDRSRRGRGDLAPQTLYEIREGVQVIGMSAKLIGRRFFLVLARFAIRERGREVQREFKFDHFWFLGLATTKNKLTANPLLR